MSAETTRESLTRALHRHVCGTDYDEWNQTCSWAGEDWDYDNGPNTCAYVGEVGVESAVFAWLAGLANDGLLVERISLDVMEVRDAHPRLPDDADSYEVTAAALRALATVCADNSGRAS